MQLTPMRAEEVRASFARQGSMRLIGARMVELGYGACAIELPFSAALGQQEGFFHGGIIGAVADSAGGYAAMSMLPAGVEVVTLEYKINFLRPAIGSRLLARGIVLRAGRRVVVTRCDVVAGDGDGLKLCAALQQSVARSTTGG